MIGPAEITKGIYMVGGPGVSDSRDCSVYLIDLGELILIDSGAGVGVEHLVGNISQWGLEPGKITTVILTHCHIDHVGGAHLFRERYGSRIIMHELDAAPVELGDQRMTAAYWYGVQFAPLPIDVKLKTDEQRLSFGNKEIVCVHTPGHTPGSISVYIDMDGKRVLFGQDIHGPFLAEFGADLSRWQRSMEKLLSLKADILCEGHFGVYKPGEKVVEYIRQYLDEYGD